MITIVDFSKPSLEERGYVIDLKNKKIIYSTYVMHELKYAKPIEGAPGRSKSLGCPSVPIELAKPIIDKIKNESVFYIHTNLQTYTSKSKLI